VSHPKIKQLCDDLKAIATRQIYGQLFLCGNFKIVIPFRPENNFKSFLFFVVVVAVVVDYE